MAKNRYTTEQLKQTIMESNSWAEVCRVFGIPPATGSQTHLKNRAAKENIDFSHFNGYNWRRGKSFPNEATPIEKYFSGEIKTSSHKLKLRLIKDGIKTKECEKCGISEWLGYDLPLELDHINNNHYDNYLENLQILCPNCHAVKTRNAGT